MRSAWILVIAALLLSSVAQGRNPAFYLGGVQVHERDPAHWVETLTNVGMNTVAVTVYAKQGNWDGSDLTYRESEPSVVDEIRTARASGLAVVLILRVALQHDTERNKFLWHGQIMPGNERLLASWFDRYTSFALKWARIAEAEGVSVLGIGSEMKALVATRPVSRSAFFMRYHGFNWYQRVQRNRIRQFADQIEKRHLWVRGFDNYENLGAYLDARYEQNRAWSESAYLWREDARYEALVRRRVALLGHWSRLIDRVRQAYSGSLTYAANFDSYRDVAFWPRLDMIGINAYFSLRDHVNDEPQAPARLQRFAARWREIFDELHEFAADVGASDQPVLFTELGYTFRRHSTVEPWAHDGFSVVGWNTRRRRLVVWGDQPPDYEERMLALRALEQVRRSHATRLAGILYWKLSTDKNHESIEPFVLHIGPESSDPLQRALVDFVSPGRAHDD